jgi:hypothetical protein
MYMSGQFHTSAALCPMKEAALDVRLDGPQNLF